MITINKALDPQISVSTLPKTSTNKHNQIIEKTFKNNTDSDYTEKLTELGAEFDYSKNSSYYWSPPDLSLLYGTPLYAQASASQKLALNHLYWVGNYNHTAISEATTSLYNMVTAGVFRAVGGYDTLCDELEFETDQESYHIRTFQRIGFKTKQAIVGKTFLGNSQGDEFLKKSLNHWPKGIIPKPVQDFFISNKGHSPYSVYQAKALSAIAKTMLKDKIQYYSQYLRDLEARNQLIPAPADGLGGRMASPQMLRFYTLHWGISPFMACQYYSLRYTANAILKNQEYPYVRYYRQLEQKGEYIPTPTAVSFYHLLDEAFHTTISQTLAKDTYKDFPKPTAYEKFISGLMIYKMQCNLLSGLSGVLPGRCVNDDPTIMLFYYRLLKSPLFDMETQEALHWLEQSFCTEHEGFHVGIKYHQSLLELMRRLFTRLDYQWPINREMGIMAAGGSIEKALENNNKVFKQFSQEIGNREDRRGDKK